MGGQSGPGQVESGSLMVIRLASTLRIEDRRAYNALASIPWQTALCCPVMPRQKTDLERIFVSVTPAQRAWLEYRRKVTGSEVSAIVRLLIQAAMEAPASPK